MVVRRALRVLYDKTGPFGTCATHPIIVNLFTSKQHRMARLRSHKTQKALIRQYTPPPDLAQYVGQAKTPQRSAVFALRALARKRDLTLT